jgi:hypothetical protein
MFKEVCRFSEVYSIYGRKSKNLRVGCLAQGDQGRHGLELQGKNRGGGGNQLPGGSMSPRYVLQLLFSEKSQNC